MGYSGGAAGNQYGRFCGTGKITARGLGMWLPQGLEGYVIGFSL